MKHLRRQLARIAEAARRRPDPNMFTVIQAVATRWDARPPGLYRDGPPGSTAGRLVYDPAAGEPVAPEERLAPWGLLIVVDPACDLEPL